MCLAVPGKVVKRNDGLKATVDMMGIERPVSLRLVPTAQVGDYVLVHAGFGIQIVNEQEAQETLVRSTNSTRPRRRLPAQRTSTVFADVWALLGT